MNKITKIQIDTFVSQPVKAVIGVSRNKRKFGYMVFNELRQKGYRLLPVNPHADTIDDVPCYKSIDQLPGEVTAAIVLTPKNNTLDTVQQLINKGIKHIWIQQKAETREAIELALKNQVQLVHGKCIFMFSDPVTGGHKFHKTLLKFFGKLPK